MDGKKKKGIDSSDGLMPNASPITSTTTPDNLNSDGKDIKNNSDEQKNGEKNAEWSIKGQYDKLKEKYPDAIILFHVGDFYEVYFEDAEAASEILGLAAAWR